MTFLTSTSSSPSPCQTTTTTATKTTIIDGNDDVNWWDSLEILTKEAIQHYRAYEHLDTGTMANYILSKHRRLESPLPEFIIQ